MIGVGGRLILYFKSTLQQVVVLNSQYIIKHIFEQKQTRVL